MKNTLGILKVRAMPALAIAALSFGAAAAAAQDAEVLRLDIEAQQAGSALMELASSSGVQIMLPDQAGAEVEVEGLKGEYQFEEALAALLTDTGLAYQFTSKNVVLVQQAGEELQEVEAADDSEAIEEEEPIELAEQTVTGSRLIGGDPSARVYSFSSEDIARRGVSSLEEFFRTLPYVFPSVTTQTATNTSLTNNEGVGFAGNAVGVSAINLRGLGVANTLVLMNGRRIAGTGGQEKDFANLLNVPLSAIERVDIQLDGASAVYGSDAIGGVVNFITKKNYRGLSATYRHEYSGTDADSTTGHITGGWFWGSGNITATLSRSTSKPITNEKTGWTTLDMRPLLGPEFDFRRTDTSQPGIACALERSPFDIYYPDSPPTWICEGQYTYSPRWVPPTFYQLPAGHSGLNATIEDFAAFPQGGEPPTPLDELAPQNGADTTTESVAIRLDQQVTGSLKVFADLNWSFNDSYQEYDRAGGLSPFLIPASNAYNPFGKPMRVWYAPIQESETGLLPAQYNQSENEKRDIRFGAIWTFGDGHELLVDANRTKSWRETNEFRFNPGASRGKFDPTAEAFYAAISSSDPAVALNVFGNGTAQGSSFKEYLTDRSGPSYGLNETRQYNATLRGQLFNLWGGAVSYSLGGEFRQNISYDQSSRTTHGTYIYERIDQDIENISGSSLRSVGVARPSRDVQAYYGELALPIFGADNARPGARSLILTLQARYDVSESVGAAASGYERQYIDVREWYWDPERTEFDYVVKSLRVETVNDPELGTARAGRISPRAGLQYRPVEDLEFRAAWRRSFSAPTWSEQFSTREDRNPRPWCSDWQFTKIDPYDPDGPTEITCDLGVTVDSTSYTPDIQPEYSDSWAFNFAWTPSSVPGLRWNVDWSYTDYTNGITSSSDYLDFNPDWVLNHPQVAVRNERGDLQQVYRRRINITERYNELLNTSLQYSFETRFGAFTPRVGYTRYLEDFQQVVETAPKETDIGTQLGNENYKLNGSLGWYYGRWTGDLFVYYSPSYLNDEARWCISFELILLPGSRCKDFFEYVELPVSSLTTVDLTLTYQMDNGLRIRAGGRNILDRAAPLTVSNAHSTPMPYDPTRWNARGRVFYLELNWEM